MKWFMAVITAALMATPGACADNSSHEDSCKNRGGIVKSVDFQDNAGNNKRSYWCEADGKIVDRW